MCRWKFFLKKGKVVWSWQSKLWLKVIIACLHLFTSFFFKQLLLEGIKKASYDTKIELCVKSAELFGHYETVVQKQVYKTKKLKIRDAILVSIWMQLKKKVKYFLNHPRNKVFYVQTFTKWLALYYMIAFKHWIWGYKYKNLHVDRYI